MTTPTTLAPAAIAERVAETIDGIFATVDEWRDDLAAWFLAHPRASAVDLDAKIEALVLGALDADSLVTGAGFVAAPGMLSDAHWHLAWWLGGAGGPRRLASVDDPASDQFRDYTALEWWRFPARTLTRHLTGPYVDYVCTDDYTVTITTPVLVAGEMVGVVGTDALVDRLEHELLPLLSAGGQSAALVNAAGRIVTATDARREPGSILRMPGLAEALAPLRANDPARVDADLGADVRVLSCGDTSLALVLGI